LAAQQEAQFAHRVSAVTNTIFLIAVQLCHRAARGADRLEDRVIAEASTASRLSGADPMAATFDRSFNIVARVAVSDRADVFKAIARLGLIDQKLQIRSVIALLAGPAGGKNPGRTSE
jgi:hypothetical protein